MPADPKAAVSSSLGAAASPPPASGSAAAAERDKALGLVLTQIERNFGKGSIMKLGARGAEHDIEVVSTGSLGLDMMLRTCTIQTKMPTSPANTR